jgi:hypothetical protein
MTLRARAKKLFNGLFGLFQPAESPLVEIDAPSPGTSKPPDKPAARRQNTLGSAYLPVDDVPIQQAFTADFQSAKSQGDNIRLSALKTLQRNVVSRATSGNGTIKLSRKHFIQVVQECIQQSREVAGIFRETGDGDLALNEEQEVAVLQAYLTPPAAETPLPIPPAIPSADKPPESAPLPPQPVVRHEEQVAPRPKARTRSLSCAKCQTSERNWLFRHDAAGRPFPTCPNYRSNSGRMLVLCPDCLIAALAADRFERKSPTQPQRETPHPPAVKRSGYDGRYAPNIQEGFSWKGTGYCQHCNRRSMPGGDVCYCCNPD